MTRVKVCGLTSLADAEASIELGADALGFIYEPTSPRYVGDDEQASELPLKLGPYALTVAVFGRYTDRFTGAHAVQFVSGYGGPAVGPRLVQAIRLLPDMQLKDALREVKRQLMWSPAVDAILLDAFDAKQFGGTGKRVDWELAAEVVRSVPYKVVLAGGLTPENVAEAVKVVRPYAVDVSSGVEAKARVKDLTKVRDFIQAAKSA